MNLRKHSKKPSVCKLASTLMQFYTIVINSFLSHSFIFIFFKYDRIALQIFTSFLCNWKINRDLFSSCLGINLS